MRKEKLIEIKRYIEELKATAVLGEEEIKDSKFTTLKKATFHLNNDAIVTGEEIVKNGNDGSAVIVLPITQERNVILTIKPRPYTKLIVEVGLPSGYIEKGESSFLIALRELREETGHIPTIIKKIATFYQDEGCSRALNHSFIAFGCRKRDEQHLDCSEHVRYVECTYEEALELVEMNYIKGANSILTLEKAKPYIKRI